MKSSVMEVFFMNMQSGVQLITKPLSIIALLMMGLAGVASANPSSVDPSRNLAAHGTIPGSKELIARLYEVYEKTEKLAIELNSSSMKPERYPYKQIERIAGEVWKATRDAKDGVLRGEPAAKDIDYRLALANMELFKLATKYRRTTPGGKQYIKNKTELDRKKPRTEQSLTKIQQAIQRNQLDQAEQQLIPLGIELYSKTYIFSPPERTKYMSTFNSTIGALDSKLNPIKRKRYFDQARQVAGRELAKVNEFVAEASRVKSEIKSSGKAKVGEAELGPGKAIEYLVGKWGGASAALIRSNAIQWAFTGKRPSDVNSSTMSRIAQLKETATNAIVGVIDAAAAATPAEEIPQVYADVVSALSFADRRTVVDGISDECGPALTVLANKGGASFVAQVAAYKKATQQPLIWRERFAQASAKNLESGYRNSRGIGSLQLVPKATNKPAIYGNRALTKRQLISSNLGGGPNWKVYEAASAMLGMRVSEPGMLRLKPGSLTGIVPHDAFHYANVAVGMPIKRQFGDLRTALLVDANHPPLSIEAAGAVSAAEWEDYKLVGGEISRLHLEAALTRFISLPDVAYPLAALGSLPTVDDETPVIEQSCWRFDIAPHWVQHQYFTVAIPNKLPK